MMVGRYWNVKLKRGTSEKNVKIHATSESNARHEAERQNPGWSVVDVRPG